MTILPLTSTTEHWTLRAKCRNKWHLFDAQDDSDGNPHYPFLRDAQDLCDTCPVFDICEEKRKGEVTGIWAGQPL